MKKYFTLPKEEFKRPSCTYLSIAGNVPRDKNKRNKGKKNKEALIDTLRRYN